MKFTFADSVFHKKVCSIYNSAVALVNRRGALQSNMPVCIWFACAALLKGKMFITIICVNVALKSLGCVR